MLITGQSKLITSGESNGISHKHTWLNVFLVPSLNETGLVSGCVRVYVEVNFLKCFKQSSSQRRGQTSEKWDVSDQR